MLRLKDVLKTKDAREGIDSDLSTLIHLDLNDYLSELISNLDKNINNITEIINYGIIKYKLSCTLYYDSKQNIYLLECWLSNYLTNEDINTFFAIFNSDGNRIMHDDDRCVWSIGDWHELTN